MLSEDEQHELRVIEQMLLADPRFASSVRGARPRPGAGRFGPDRLLLAGGVLIMVMGLLFGLAGAFLQGLTLAAVGFVWSRWARLVPRSPHRAARRQG